MALDPETARTSSEMMAQRQIAHLEARIDENLGKFYKEGEKFTCHLEKVEKLYAGVREALIIRYEKAGWEKVSITCCSSHCRKKVVFSVYDGSCKEE